MNDPTIPFSPLLQALARAICTKQYQTPLEWAADNSWAPVQQLTGKYANE